MLYRWDSCTAILLRAMMRMLKLDPVSERTRLSVVSDSRGLAKVGLILAGLATSLAMDYTATSWGYWPGFLGALIATVWTQHAIAEEIHDGVHSLLLHSRSANDRLSEFYSSLIGISFAQFRIEHLDHHRHFGTPADPDYDKYADAPKGVRVWAGYFLFYFSGYAALKRLVSGPKRPQAPS
jgi:fatty acid desaturase